MVQERSSKAVFVKAFLNAIQHQATFDEDATWSKHGLLNVAGYAELREWHWPRDFRFKEEFYTLDEDPDSVVNAVAAYGPLETGSHLISAFHADTTCTIKAYEQLGYQHCFTKRLLCKHLDDGDVISDHPVVQFRSVDDADFGEIDKSERPVNWAMAADHTTHHFCVCIDGKAVSWGMVVTSNPSIAYVGQMFTLPTFRRRGYGAAVLSHMHTHSRETRSRAMILMPSYETVDWYPKFGYEPVAECVILCPQE